MPDFSLERRLAERRGLPVAGIDEAGRGPWAGPVVAAAVVLDVARLPARLAEALDDSKLLKPSDRDTLHRALFDLAAAGHAHIAVGRAEVEEIDSLNILAATMAAMARAVAALDIAPAAALVDGNRAPALPCPAEPVIKGDARSLSVAAASIIAKVSRDREMAALARRYPGYGWERNRGYGTAEHQAALRELGPTPQHRRSFRPVRDFLKANKPD